MYRQRQDRCDPGGEVSAGEDQRGGGVEKTPPAALAASPSFSFILVSLALILVFNN